MTDRGRPRVRSCDRQHVRPRGGGSRSTRCCPGWRRRFGPAEPESSGRFPTARSRGWSGAGFCHTPSVGSGPCSGRYGVGLTVTALGRAEPEAGGACRAVVARRPSRLTDRCRPRRGRDAEMALELRPDRGGGGDAGRLQGGAGRRSGRPPPRLSRTGSAGQPGRGVGGLDAGVADPPAPGVCEFFADELAMILNCSPDRGARCWSTSRGVLVRPAAGHLGGAGRRAARLAAGRGRWPPSSTAAGREVEPAADRGGGGRGAAAGDAGGRCPAAGGGARPS